jgi:hypothetical protein
VQSKKTSSTVVIAQIYSVSHKFEGCDGTSYGRKVVQSCEPVVNSGSGEDWARGWGDEKVDEILGSIAR